MRVMIALVAIAIPVAIYNFWDTGSTSSAAPPTTNHCYARAEKNSRAAGRIQPA